MALRENFDNSKWNNSIILIVLIDYTVEYLNGKIDLRYIAEYLNCIISNLILNQNVELINLKNIQVFFNRQ